MSPEIPTNSPNKKVVDDNARKFIVQAPDLEYLKERSDDSYTIETDWLKIGEGTEQKVVRKGNEMLLISKTTTNGSRKAEKESISRETYDELRANSILHSKKERYEVEYHDKKGVQFLLKYDMFDGGRLCMLEVEAATQEERDAFNPNDFPAEMTEVTGEPGYTGYEIVGTLEALAR